MIWVRRGGSASLDVGSFSPAGGFVCSWFLRAASFGSARFGFVKRPLSLCIVNAMLSLFWHDYAFERGLAGSLGDLGCFSNCKEM